MRDALGSFSCAKFLIRGGDLIDSEGTLLVERTGYVGRFFNAALLIVL